MIKYARSGYEKGFWSKNVLTKKNPVRDSFEKGTSGATWANPKQANETWQKIKDAIPGATYDYFDITTNYKIYERKSVAVAGMSIPVNAKNPERALMVIEKLHQDADYNRLLTYGLEGKHWELDKDGNIRLPVGVTAERSGWVWDKPNPWGFRDNKFFLTDPVKQKGSWDVIKKVWQKYTDNYMFDPSFTFAFDKTPVSSEFAACENVMKQYFTPLIFGVVVPDAGLKELNVKMKQAGFDRIKSEFYKQWMAYKQVNNIR